MMNTDTCIFTQCQNATATDSRIVCSAHQAEVDVVEAELYGCRPVPPLPPPDEPKRCPHCSSGSIARSYPLSARVWRCQRPGCTRTFSVGGD